jgi:phosphoserine phosphatase RsbU/P
MTDPWIPQQDSRRAMAWRAVIEGSLAALAVYVIAGGGEAALISVLHPTELELTWVSDVVLAVAFGVAVYLWRNLRATRRELTTLERTELVLQTQLSLAEDMQRRLLPAVPSPRDGIEWAATLIPAGRIGGDFYDFVERSPGVWLTLVADVSGKGVPAAMALGVLRSTFRRLTRDSLEPSALVSLMSAALYSEWEGAPYVTCLVAEIDTRARRITYANCGHPAGMLVRSNDEILLSTGGPPIGLLPIAAFEQDVVALRSGDVCLLVTDGITEALEASAEPALAVATLSARTDRASAASICHAVMTRALAGQGPLGVDEWEDDRTVVVIKAGEAV